MSVSACQEQFARHLTTSIRMMTLFYTRVPCLEQKEQICTAQTVQALCVCFFSERDAQRADARRRESESETQLRDIHNLSNQLANRNQPIQEYISQNKADALQRLTADLDACKKRQDKLEAEVQVPLNSTLRPPGVYTACQLVVAIPFFPIWERS
jgi:hypothetical protein